jgi:hypothetical protein
MTVPFITKVRTARNIIHKIQIKEKSQSAFDYDLNSALHHLDNIIDKFNESVRRYKTEKNLTIVATPTEHEERQ